MESPSTLVWRDVVDHVVRSQGGWTKAADELGRRLHLAGQNTPDLTTIEKGLRRLAGRKSDSGGQYGRWLLRYFGIPADIERQLRWIAQYHSRFGDMPTSLRLQHLRLFDRPPVAESAHIAWIHVGMASAHHRRREHDECAERLAAARSKASNAGPLAVLEAELLAARIATDRDSRREAMHIFEAIEPLIDANDAEHLPYRARLHAQRAFHLTRPLDGEPDVEAARELFLAIPEATHIPFVDYRRTAGLAYCSWRLGDVEEGRRLAKLACVHAGDGGLIRFRVMALNMLAKMSEPDEATALRARAERLASSIEDYHLVAVATRAP